MKILAIHAKKRFSLATNVEATTDIDGLTLLCHAALVVDFKFFFQKGPIQQDGGWSGLQIKYSSLHAVYLYLASRLGWLTLLKVAYRVNLVLKQNYFFVVKLHVSWWKPSKYINFLADVMIKYLHYMTVINRMLFSWTTAVLMVLPQTNDTQRLIGRIWKPLSRLWSDLWMCTQSWPSYYPFIVGPLLRYK